ncbi:HlyD family efflux transporter periplasmic adaptor subunit [Thalassotalea sp. 1_MG-2023]|uniref:HlyD family secretion protein n=1 Tax=Thalassotalea sp. 1_MG-2023 TaxID=3062680 RepID=UPI0026E48515|nr:HlyD family efflux transporter periplasmic adaptor subunit [Thalassotalea sp. 1_MG-2023]MDO6425754.1 HlyD family efflux transporter periplasmic adaptor subunit [Thalassotalea sp. 1_MG-2023]
MKYLCLIVCCLCLIACSENETKLTVKSAKTTMITASGELESKTSALIAPPSVGHMWQYQIKTLVPDNSKVKAGQLLVAFDDKKVTDRLINQQAKLQQAKKELENKQNSEQEKEQELILALAEKQMEFDKSQRRISIVDNSQSDNDRRKAQIDFTIAESDLEMAKKRLVYHRKNSVMNLKRLTGKVNRITSKVNALLADKEKLKVKAPIDGMAIYRANWQGEKPAVGENIQFGQPIIELSVLEEMQVLAQITEPDSGKVSEGQAVKILLDSANEVSYDGKIAEMGSVFRDKSHQDKTRVIDAVISLDDINLKVMRPGMSARIEVLPAISAASTTGSE